MAVKTAALQFATWDLTAGATPKSPGLLMGGQMVARSEVSVRYGGQNQASRFAGRVRYSGRIQAAVTSDSKAFLQQGIRTAGVLPALKIIGGDDDLDITQDTVYLNTLRISGSVDEPMTYDADWIALTDVEAATGGTPVALSSDLLPLGGASVTVEGDPYVCQTFEVGVDNGIADYGSLDAKTAGAMRLPVGLNLGQEKIEFRTSCLLQQPWAVGEDVPSGDLGAIISYTDGVNTLTLTLTDLMRQGDRPMPFETESGLVVWQYEFSGLPGSLAIT